MIDFTNKIKLFSFFSGAGFLDLGFEASGYKLSYINEISRPFMEAYKFARSSMKINVPEYGYFEGDVNELVNNNNINELVEAEHKNSNLVGFIGGPPCPDFSIGGKNKGRNGENGKLSASYINLICQAKPDFFLFENVKGLWRTKIHREFFEEIKLKVQLEGYVTTERLINAIEFGAPQDRERIIMLGFRKGLLKELGKNVKDDATTIEEFPWRKYIKYPKEEVFNLPWPQTNKFIEDSVLECPSGLPKELTAEYWFNKNEVMSHANANDYFQPRAGLIRFQTIDEGDDSKKSYKRLHRWRYSPTAAYGNNEVHLHPYKPRRLSVSEALAIQSLPKEFVLPEYLTLTDKFKTIGNGVPYIAAKALALTIKHYLEDQYDSNSI